MGTPIPEVFVLWHPQCQIGAALAPRIYDWLRPGNGLGPEVYYRSLAAPDAPPDGLPPAIPGESRGSEASNGEHKVSNLQIILPLIDENMIVDPAWRHWLLELGDKSSSLPPRKLLPVALDATAFNLPGTLRELNFLRPSGLPLSTPGTFNDFAFETVVRSLLKQLTEAMCRVLLSRPEPASTKTLALEGAPPKITLFLSHAKIDGTAPAKRLRDHIYSQTQLGAFYDQNDIAYGSAFSRAIENDVASAETAAFIAIRSAQYARRAWCRRELSLFRRPRPEPTETQATSKPLIGGNVERWRMYPAIVVEAMEDGKHSPGIAEFGNSPLIRWHEATAGLEEAIVTTVIRDAMLASYHSAVGASIAAKIASDPPNGAGSVVINWLPDPTTLLLIPKVQSDGMKAEADEMQSVHIVHPGRGLSGMELQTLAEYFPSVTFHSFEERLSS